jgi:hypothetical protein
VKKVLLALVFLASLSTGAALEVSIVDRSGTAQDLFFDREYQVSEYYDGFHSEFEEPDKVGSLSFTDDSIVSEDVLLNISGNNSTLYDKRIQLFYGSLSGNLTEPMLTHAARIGDFSGDHTLVEVEISAFEAVYPGKIYTGFVNRSNFSDPENLTLIGDTRMAGEFDVVPTVFGVADETRLWLKAASDSRGEELHPDRELSKDILLSVKDEGEIVREERVEMGENISLNFSLDGGEEVYVNSILSLETEVLDPCGKASGDSVYFLLNESVYNVDPSNTSGGNRSCVQIHDSEDSVLDFVNYTVDGDDTIAEPGECGVTVNNSENIRVKYSRVTHFQRGICVLDSDAEVKGTHATGNQLGVYADEAVSEVLDMELQNNATEISAGRSELVMDRVEIESAEISGTGSNISVDDVENPPPPPDGALEVGQWTEIRPERGEPLLSEIGFHYPPVNETGVEPLYIYKVDEGSDNYRYRNLSNILKKPSIDYIYSTEQITEFSVFAPYGGEPEENESDGGEDEDEGEGGTGGSGGGGGGGGGGGLPGLPGTSPEPGEVKLNLSLNSSSVTLQQGETGEVNFSLENYGEVAAEDMYVTGIVRDGWSSGRQDFGNISPGSTVSDSILVEVYQSEIPGNYSVPVEIRDGNGTIYDRESINVVVEPRKRIRDLRVVEGPTFLTVTSGSTQEIAFLLRNTGDYDLEGVSPEARNLEGCVESIEGEHPLEEGEISSLDFEMEINDSTGRCVGIIAFNSEKGDKLAIKPVRINVVKPTILEQVRGYILPLLVLIWTLFTIYWLWRVRNER